jgi:hypothetical protein
MTAPLDSERLSSVAPDLADRIRSVDSLKRNKAALVAITVAVEQVGLRNPRIDEAISQLRAGQTDSSLKSELEDRGRELDTRYWDLQASELVGDASEEECIAAFRHARAVSSLFSAFHDDELHGVLESVYEAYYAATDGRVVLETVAGALDS